MAIYKTALLARVMATHEAPRVEVPKPHTFSGKHDAYSTWHHGIMASCFNNSLLMQASVT